MKLHPGSLNDSVSIGCSLLCAAAGAAHSRTPSAHARAIMPPGAVTRCILLVIALSSLPKFAGADQPIADYRTITVSPGCRYTGAASPFTASL